MANPRSPGSPSHRPERPSASTHDLRHLAEILRRETMRWLSVKPQGFQLEPGRIVPVVRTRLVRYGAARTLYQQRRPICRSLDGVTSSQPPGQRCASCPKRDRCTAQIRLDLDIDRRPYCILLARTSANNFIAHATHLERRGLSVHDAVHLLRVRRHGSWNEVCFGVAEDPP